MDRSRHRSRVVIWRIKFLSKCGVPPVLRNEDVMGSRFDDSSLVEYDDSIAARGDLRVMSHP
jgi:hypothetical protein